ncbi:tetratricopeptide repeat protein [Terrihabitans rhizophilus]|uniref:Tetratricopeptide repeat protein n=1 Tax=Terrihabitans rhizophilus TaxID=3092662 RepID=A0ABU4RR80_9HYPH|nr:tetratricopeptide repeat protein [Terrihabitans sp. PJ23]MDX6807349.1 tetratricopeptide repeat protein [Terrihabitans sp. PJ23]
MKILNCLALTAALLAGVAPVAARESDMPAQEAGNSILGNYLAGRAAASANDVSAAATYLLATLKTTPRDPELLDRTMRLVIASGDVDGAFPLAERLVALDPTNRWARLALAVRSINRKHFITARTQLGQAPRGPVPDVIGIITTAWSWQGSGETARALKTLDALSGNELAHLFRDLHAGLIADVAGNGTEAQRRLGAAYKVDQPMFIVVDAYARSLAKAGKRTEALTAYRELAERTPRNALLQASIKTLEDGGQLPLAADGPAQGVAEALFTFGQLANRDAAELALIYLNLALYLAPSHELALLTLADVQENIGQHQTAISLYEKLPPESGFSEDAGLKIAANLAQDERQDEAEAKLRDLIGKDASDRNAVVALGHLLHRKKDYAGAAEMFGKAIALIDGEPKKSDWPLFFARGVAYDGSKEFPKAEADLKRANELDPNQPAVLNYLGYSWVDRGLNVEQGLELIKKAVELRPNDGDIIDSLGWAYFKLGKYAEATAELERAVEQKPQSWEINDHLGDVYWKTDRKLEAGFQWLHALSLDIDPEKRPAIERKIKEGLEPEKPAAEARKVDPVTPAEPAAPADAPAVSAPAPSEAAPAAPAPESPAPAEGQN